MTRECTLFNPFYILCDNNLFTPMRNYRSDWFEIPVGTRICVVRMIQPQYLPLPTNPTSHWRYTMNDFLPDSETVVDHPRDEVSNKSCLLLSLPNEILTLIAYELHPREAIFLSLTCRALFYGVLSSHNAYLWFRLGRFAHSIPGYKTQWKYNLTNRRHKATKKKLVAAMQTFSSTQVPGIDYKRFLVETMLGDTDSGCQWCLHKPLIRKSYPGWKLRLCRSCVSHNSVALPQKPYCSLEVSCDLTVQQKFAFRPLGVDISHLRTQDPLFDTPTVQSLWKPDIQHALYSTLDTHVQIETSIIQKITQFTPEQKEAMNQLRAYRLRHAEAIWGGIRTRYTETYNEYATDQFQENMLAQALQKLPPSRLRQAWFLPEPYGHTSHSPSRGRYCCWNSRKFHANDPLLQELGDYTKGEKRQDQHWVDGWVEIKLARMLRILEDLRKGVNINKFYEDWDIPTRTMYRDLLSDTRQWHEIQGRNGGGMDLLKKMKEENGRGIQCPWSTCVQALSYSSIEDYSLHLSFHHRDVCVLGDTKWLVGKPSRWWPMPEGSDAGTALKNQEQWLRKWWPERWKEEHGTVLREWSENGGLFPNADEGFDVLTPFQDIH